VSKPGFHAEPRLWHPSLFLPFRLADNPYLDRAEYEARLAELPLAERERLLHGDWEIPDDGELFQRSWFELLEREQLPAGMGAVRFWDLAGSEPSSANRDPDYTVGLRLELDPRRLLHQRPGSRAQGPWCGRAAGRRDRGPRWSRGGDRDRAGARCGRGCARRSLHPPPAARPRGLRRAGDRRQADPRPAGRGGGRERAGQARPRPAERGAARRADRVSARDARRLCRSPRRRPQPARSAWPRPDEGPVPRGRTPFASDRISAGAYGRGSPLELASSLGATWYPPPTR
jgi:hypothetical protein